MRGVAVAALCLVGGIAWVVSLSFAPTAKPALNQSLPPVVAGPSAKPAEPPVPRTVETAPQSGDQAVALPEAKPAEQTAAPEPAQQPAERPAVHAAAQPEQKPAEQAATVAAIEPEQKPSEQAAAVTDAQPEATAAEKPIVQAALPSDAKSEEVTGALPPPETKPAEQPAAAPATEPPPQAASTCPGNPDAIGTSRVLTISPTEYSLLGTMQYKETLPLKDHEVVLTFDDGPIPPYTNSILDTLAANCVKATYFLVGEMARARPYLVRRIYNEGHTIGTHTQNHPLAIQHMSMDRVVRQVDGGINSAEAALGDPKALAPFFRIPGLGRTNAIEHFLEAKGLVTWSADIDTNDWWRGSTPGAIVQRTMQRLNAKGRGIILMHDIHPATALALPALLKQLKANGYRIVQVVPAGDRPKALPEVVASPAEKEIWPRALHAEPEKRSSAKVALRHRVRVALHRQRRGAQRRDGEQVEYKATSSVDVLTRSY